MQNLYTVTGHFFEKKNSCFRRLRKSNDRGGLKFWTCLHATVLLAVKYSAELNKYILLVSYLRKIPVSRTVKCPSPLKRLGIFASSLNRYFSQITLINKLYLYKSHCVWLINPSSKRKLLYGMKLKDWLEMYKFTTNTCEQDVVGSHT